MSYFVTNTSGTDYSSVSLTLPAHTSVTMNIPVLPADLSAALVSGQLTAEYLTISNPLFIYDWCGFANRGTGLGTTLQYVPLDGKNATPSTNPDQYVYPNGTKRIYNLQVVLATAPGTGASRIFTLWKNGVATALTLTFGPTDTGRKRLSLLVNVADMESLQLKCDVTGTPVSSQAAWTVSLSDSDANI